MARWASTFTITIIVLTFASTILFALCDVSEYERFSEIDDPDATTEIPPQESSDSVQEYGNSDQLWSDDDDDIESAIEDDKNLPPSQATNFTKKNKTSQSPILLVSTLDGTVSALDTEDGGKILWKIETGPGSLLSSSISKVELNSNGRSVRLIPSLDGGIYKFDEEGIEPLPISAESLLHSSFRAADDLLITGGKEVRTYGINPYSGRVQYVCAAGGCHVEPVEASSSGEFLIIRRHSQIIRAIAPKSGREIWNFSVGRHEASIIHTEAESFAKCKTKSKTNTGDDLDDCLLKNPYHSSDGEATVETTDARSNPAVMEFKVVVPDGVVCAVHPKKAGHLLWKHKFDTPVVHVWQLVDGKLVPLDLFSPSFIPALEEQPSDYLQSVTSPLLYVGIHNQQLYVQESPRMATQVASEAVKSGRLPLQYAPSFALTSHRIQWQPLEASSMSHQGRPGRFTIPPSSVSAGAGIRPIEGSGSLSESDKNTRLDDSRTTAMIIRHQTDYPFERGFYLFEDEGKSDAAKTATEITENSTHPGLSDDVEFWEGGKDSAVHSVIVALWVCWREVVFISLVTALLFHMIITRQVVDLLQRRWAIELQRQINALLPSLARVAALEIQRGHDQLALMNAPTTDGETDVRQPAQSSHAQSALVQPTVPEATVGESPAPSYISRYLTDFEPIQCLGRGGFGLVFEARNRLDDCHYAVKRIQLPNSEEAREKVMREVKALAKLDNKHIVRYFHAWIECPPPGWQESQDEQWIDSESLTGPIRYNTEEESDMSASNVASSLHSSSSVEKSDFRMSNLVRSIDLASKRRKSVSEDSSFAIVFEDSNRKSVNGVKNAASSSTVYSYNSTQSEESWSAGQGSTSAIAKLSVKKSIAPQRNYSVADAKMFLFIQMQLCRKESLREWLRTHVTHRDTLQVLKLFNEIVLAVEYVHHQGLIHRDLKPSNIFFAPDGAIKIGDFGLVTAMTEEAYFQSPMSPSGVAGTAFSPFQRTHTDQVGTQMYMSPEQIEGKPYNHKVDIYSLGLIFVELLWPLGTQMEQVTVISQLRSLRWPTGFPEKYPDETLLLKKMLSRNPDERPTTCGIRASSPLCHVDPSNSDIPEELHYNLQHRPRSATRTSSTSSQ